MTISLNPAIVRVRAANGHVVGAGFLVTDRRVLTCAHIVNGALGLPNDTPNPPQADLHLDFPLLAPESALTARVSHWQPAIDVAVLELTTDPPAESKPVCLVTADDLWGHSFRAFGFPSGHEDGVWTSGALRGRTAAGWVQIEDVKEPGYWVQPGFSGTPVWDEQLNGVVGMAVAVDTDRTTKAAFMIPAQQLIQAWPELAKINLQASSSEYLGMQLAQLEEAQRKAADPGRFQSQINALREWIAAWDGRVERQRERIAEGLKEQRRQRTEERERREKERLRVVGQPPLDVADYFKDRERDLKKLGQLLAEPTTRLVSVIGHGGMGKTALACKIFQDLEHHRWPHTNQEAPVDGIAYLSTRTTGISLERLFLDCAKLLGGERQERLTAIWTNPQLETQEKIVRLLEALSEERCVILLDNLEDLLDDQGQLTDDDLRLFFEQSLVASQGTQLVVTSRVALAFRREVMRFDRQVKLLEGLPVEDGVALLRELDPNSDYGLRDASEENLAEAVELAHGMPRALEVLTGILANDPFASLNEVVETFYEQKDVVQALIEENYKRLDRDDRRVVEALAVFKKPVPPLAVDYLLEPFAPGLDVPSIVRRLARTNIVSVDRTAKTVTLHPIDQDYASSQLPEEDGTESDYTRQALERRVADYYVQLRTPPETWKTIDDLAPQLAEFEHRIRGGDYKSACWVLEAIDSDYLHLWGHFARLVELREKLQGKLTDLSLQSANLGGLGRAYYYLGAVEKAKELHQRALIISRQTGDRRTEGTQLGDLGLAYHNLGQIKEAIDCYEQALSISQEIGNHRGKGRILERLGLVYHDLLESKRAIEFLEQALDIARETDDRKLEGDTRAVLGSACRALGQVEQAVRHYEQALTIFRKISYPQGAGICLVNLGISHCSLGKVERAKELYQQALTISRQIGDRRTEGVQLGNLGLAYHALGQFKKAIECQDQALEIFPEVGYRKGEGIGLGHQGNAYRILGQLERAIKLYEEALVIVREIGYRREERDQLLGMSKALLAIKELSEARQYCLEALALDVPETNYQAALVLGIVLLHQRDPVAGDTFADTITHCRATLEKTAGLYEPRYALAAALVGQTVCAPHWADENKRPELLALALEEYGRALEITAAPGIVQDAIRDLELIRAAGIEGLEPVFKRLESAEYEPGEVFTDVLEE